MTNYGLNNLYTAPAYDSAGAPIVDKRLTVSSAVVTIAGANNFTASGGTPNTANLGTISAVDVDIQGDNVFATWDGTTPSASNGHLLYKGNFYTFSYRQWIALKLIRQTTDATIQASAMQV